MSNFWDRYQLHGFVIAPSYFDETCHVDVWAFTGKKLECIGWLRPGDFGNSPAAGMMMFCCEAEARLMCVLHGYELTTFEKLETAYKEMLSV